MQVGEGARFYRPLAPRLRDFARDAENAEKAAMKNHSAAEAAVAKMYAKTATSAALR